MILRFGNVTLLSMEELSGKLFTGNGTKMSIMKDGGRWEDHPLDTTVYGVNVEVKRGREGGEGREGGRERVEQELEILLTCSCTCNNYPFFIITVNVY